MRQPPVTELCDGAAHQTAPPYESDECWRNTTCSCEPSARIHADRDRDRDGADAKVQLGPYQGQQPRQVPLNDARIETSGKQAIVHPEHGLNGCLASARNALRSTDAKADTARERDWPQSRNTPITAPGTPTAHAPLGKHSRGAHPIFPGLHFLDQRQACLRWR